MKLIRTADLRVGDRVSTGQPVTAVRRTAKLTFITIEREDGSEFTWSERTDTNMVVTR